MKARLAKLVAALRRDGIAVSVAESIDAAAAVASLGLEREALKHGLAATLVKDERDRPAFDRVFDEHFPRSLESAQDAERRRRRRADGGEGAGSERAPRSGARGGASSRGAPRAGEEEDARGRPDSAEPDRDRRDRTTQSHGEKRGAAAKHVAPESTHGSRVARAPRDNDAGEHARLLSRRERERELLTMPFGAMAPRDVEEASALVRMLARRLGTRFGRRFRPRPRGRLDFRRTIRAAVPHGGVPVDRRFRGRRPAKPVLVALCDLSASTATATDFFLALLAPAARYFARVRFFGFVDRLVEIEFEGGQVRPAGPIDLMARSDFGRVLIDLMAGPAYDLTANTLLLVLGDARNNRRPHRADLLARARARVRRVIWLNPDAPERWNTGDSVIATYARHADLVLQAGSLAELDRALAQVARPSRL